jgi:hypothetical protein
MATTKTVDVEIYQLHVWIRQISPMIWRRLLVRSDSSIADLHYTLQIAFGWSDEHLNQFHIHGQDYGQLVAGFDCTAEVGLVHDVDLIEFA